MAKTYRKRVKTEGRVENRTDLFNYILAKLTSDSIPVQDDQVHIAIDDAWEKFNNHHHLANEEFFAIYRYTDEDLARFASPPVICLIEKNDRKPFLKSRPFSKSKFYTESFEGQYERKQNQSYLPIKNDNGNLSIDSDSVLDGLDDYTKAYRYNVPVKRFLEEDTLGNRVDSDGNKIVENEGESLEDYQKRTLVYIPIWKYTEAITIPATEATEDSPALPEQHFPANYIYDTDNYQKEISDTFTLIDEKYISDSIENLKGLFNYTYTKTIDDVAVDIQVALDKIITFDINTTLKEYNDFAAKTPLYPITKANNIPFDPIIDAELLNTKISEIITSNLYPPETLWTQFYTPSVSVPINNLNIDYLYGEFIDESEVNQVFFDKGNNPALLDDEFIEESNQIADDQWYYLVRKMKTREEIDTLLKNEANQEEYENIIQNDMIDFEKVDRNYLTDKQYGYFFSNGIYWSQANQNDLIVNNIFVDLPEDIGSITKIVNATGQSFGTFFTGLENTALLNSSFASVYGASTAGVGALMQFDMVGFFVMNRHFDMMNKYIVSEQPIGFSFQNKRLYIYDNIKRFVKGDTMMMKGYKRNSNVSQGDLWNNIWLKSYATALTQRQWALNITNASGVTGPGNATLPAQEILAEANTQIEKLELQLYNNLQPGSRIISG